MSTTSKIDVYDIVTKRIIELLEAGTIPWHKPWAEAGLPANLLSKRPYRGLNVWLLLSLNYEQNLFLTWDQLKKIGGSVKQGEHGHVVVFWKTIAKGEDLEQENGEKQTPVSILRYYKVFNIAQCTGIAESLLPAKVERKNDPIVECESIIKGMPKSPLIFFKGKTAYYDIQKDEVVLPKLKSFTSSEGYYLTLFHELIHSTGHQSRLDRKSITGMAEFGDDLYTIEELIAELGACYLASFAGILHGEITNSAAYINGWLQKFKDDKRFIIQASGLAQRAVDFVLNHQTSTTENKEEVEPTELLAEE
jgi:antirestriction protein ArdC